MCLTINNKWKHLDSACNVQLLKIIFLMWNCLKSKRYSTWQLLWDMIYSEAHSSLKYSSEKDKIKQICRDDYVLLFHWRCWSKQVSGHYNLVTFLESIVLKRLHLLKPFAKFGFHTYCIIASNISLFFTVIVH